MTIESFFHSGMSRKSNHVNRILQPMTIISKVAFSFVTIILIVIICPTIIAYDNREWQYIDDGLSSLKLGNATEAIASYDKAIAINPNSATAWNYRGNALFSLDRYTEAIASYDKAIAIKPDYASPWDNRGSAELELGRYTEAVASFDKAIAINPDDAMAKSSREIALKKQSQAQTPTTPFPLQTQQQTKTTPLLYAPIGAIVLMAGIAAWIRRWDPPLK
jgi:tetratricopeptide (TPR) repeat protein